MVLVSVLSLYVLHVNASCVDSTSLACCDCAAVKWDPWGSSFNSGIFIGMDQLSWLLLSQVWLYFCVAKWNGFLYYSSRVKLASFVHCQ